jgi:hypothetical protein
MARRSHRSLATVAAAVLGATLLPSTVRASVPGGIFSDGFEAGNVH